MFVEWPEAGAGVLPAATIGSRSTTSATGGGRSPSTSRVDRYDCPRCGCWPWIRRPTAPRRRWSPTGGVGSERGGDARGSAARDVLALIHGILAEAGRRRWPTSTASPSAPARARSPGCGSASPPARRSPTAPGCRSPACRRSHALLHHAPPAPWRSSTRAAARCSPRARACTAAAYDPAALAASLPAGTVVVGDGALRYRELLTEAGATVPADERRCTRCAPTRTPCWRGSTAPRPAPRYLREPDATPPAVAR